ncbi:hypothetical protein Tsubulata_014360 [Turnera subulata]|uniref:Uncharacterized protein n=1 Tax=Turnera subulata TaxID=218843 RepID=A0A9Q0J0G6_9ROSI|nr:hypothetical protein Tsubulata_014360 [Turnera subulata]
MAELQSGVLVKFLQEMDLDGNTPRETKPVLLQIRSIIPVMRNPERLLQNQGFFLKVSDLSHALYVSLPHEEDEMVLSDKLHLGQFIYASTLEAAYPVPLLKGISPLPGRHPCYGNPKDLISMNHLQKFLAMPPGKKASDIDDVTEKTPAEEGQSVGSLQTGQHVRRGSTESLNIIPEDCNDLTKRTTQTEKKRSASASKGSLNEVTAATAAAAAAAAGGGGLSNGGALLKDRPSAKSYALNFPMVNEKLCRQKLGVSNNSRPQKNGIQSTFNYKTNRRDAAGSYKGLRKYKSIPVGEDSDSESTISSASSMSSLSKRRTWHGKDGASVRDILDIPVDKHELRCGSSTPSVSGSSVRSSPYDSSDDCSCITVKASPVPPPAKSPKLSRRSSISGPPKKTEGFTYRNVNLTSINDKVLIDSDITWDFLPPTLVNLGREVMRQRDAALLAAAEALQEASANDKLLKCLRLNFSSFDFLSTYSKLRLIKGAEKHPSVENFFRLQDDLAQSRIIFHALTSSLQRKAADTDTTNGHPVREALRLAVDRKQNAETWIKAAMVCDLNSVPTHVQTRKTSAAASIGDKRVNKTSHASELEGELMVKNQKQDNELHGGLAGDVDHQQRWVKGIALPTSKKLENFLQEECRTWFLTYVEDYLDWVGSEIITTESDSQANELMYQIKRVSDWLEHMMGKDISTVEEPDATACMKLKNKIYGILLKHIERTALNALS